MYVETAVRELFQLEGEEGRKEEANVCKMCERWKKKILRKEAKELDILQAFRKRKKL
jgi:hypothetical protein